MFGAQELLLIGLVLLIFFGARKIPEFMKGLGKGVREFKDGIKEPNKDTPTTPPATNRTTETTSTEERRDQNT